MIELLLKAQQLCNLQDMNLSASVKARQSTFFVRILADYVDEMVVVDLITPVLKKAERTMNISLKRTRVAVLLILTMALFLTG